MGRTAKTDRNHPEAEAGGQGRTHRRCTVHDYTRVRRLRTRAVCAYVRACVCVSICACVCVCPCAWVLYVNTYVRAWAHLFVGQVKKRKTQKSRALALFCSKNLGWERTCSLPMLRPCWEMGALKPKKTGSRSQGGRRAEAGEMSARSRFGAMDGSTHNQNVRSLFLTATISAGPLAASPGPGHNYHPTGGLRAAGAGSRPWFA